MLSRHTTKCSYCYRNILGGEHYIQKSEGIWIHQECFHLKKDGITPTPEEDMGAGSCGVCYCCIRLQGECIDAHTSDLVGNVKQCDNLVEPPHYTFCKCGGDPSHCCDNPQNYQQNTMIEPDHDECIGCETGADYDGAHTCRNIEHNYSNTQQIGMVEHDDDEECIGCETGADYDGAHTCNK